VVTGLPKFCIVCDCPPTEIVTVCGVAAAKFPAAACETVTEQLPEASVVTTPVTLTEQIAGVIEV
jgi:hypothetical protein